MLSKDYFTDPEDQIKSISSVLTVVDGIVVFGSEKYTNIAPKLPDSIPYWSPIKYFGGYYWEN
ncbi:Exoenzymes regulatory protein AepA precursor [Sphingobacterium sp. JB170]|nr:Exoenzymes regulatory protein AepA precursor [Sphingobacterium sp. JB170]